MDFSQALSRSWKEVELASVSGQLKNQSMLAFVFCDAMNAQLPDQQVTYDARVMPSHASQPNFIVWQLSKVSTVVFIGFLRFGLEVLSGLEDEITIIKGYICDSRIEVLTHNPNTGDEVVEDMIISPECEFGLFGVGRPLSTLNFDPSLYP